MQHHVGHCQGSGILPSIFPSPQSKIVRVCCFIYGVAIILVLLVRENILLDSNFSAKIGDFAVAQLTTPKQVGSTSTLSVLSTPQLVSSRGYLPPEHAEGNQGPWTDVFSYGIVCVNA